MAAQQLFNAARDGDLEMVEILLEDNVPLDTLNDTGDTPFMIAFKNMHYDVARRLAERGANVNQENTLTGSPVLCNLAKHNKAEAISRFLELPRVNPDVSDDDGKTPLALAANNSNIDVVQLLLTAGANVNKQVGGEEPEGDNALSISVRKKNYELFLILLNAGANPNAIADYEPVLLRALGFDDLRFATELLNRGANVNVEYDERPLFHAAVGFLKIPAIKLMLDHGADINIVDREDNVPLKTAITEERLDVFKFLLRQGAKVTPGVRTATANSPEFKKILDDFEALEPVIHTEPLPLRVTPNNVYARANAGETVNNIRRNLETRRAANLGQTNGGARRRKSRRGKMQRRRRSRKQKKN